MTIGIDLGDVWSHYCTLNQDGEVVDRGRFRTTAKAIQKWISVPAGGDAYVPKRVLMDWRRGGQIESPIWCSITALCRGAIIDMTDALNGRNIDTSGSRISAMVCVTCPHD
jgi:hypothetical protein